MQDRRRRGCMRYVQKFCSPSSETLTSNFSFLFSCSDCGDTPPGVYAPPESSARGRQVKYNHKLPIPCSKWCVVLPEKAPSHCGCKTRPALKAPPPLPPKGADSRLCRILCDQGTGGSICECSKKASSPAPTPDPAPLPYNPTIDCFFLCDTGKGGSLCDCGDMPPAVSGGAA